HLKKAEDPSEAFLEKARDINKALLINREGKLSIYGVQGGIWQESKLTAEEKGVFDKRDLEKINRINKEDIKGPLLDIFRKYHVHGSLKMPVLVVREEEEASLSHFNPGHSSLYQLF